MVNENNNKPKMKLVDWVSDAVKELGIWGRDGAKSEFAHDASEFDKIMNEIEKLPTTSVEDVEKWLGTFDEKLKNMKHSPEVTINTQQLFQKFFKPMIDQLELKAHSPASPELEKTLGICAASLGLGLAAYAAGMVVETISLGQIDGFDKFWDQVVKATGVYRISTMLTTMPLKLGVMRPLGYEYNTVYQTFKPKMREIVRWYGRGHIGDQGMRDFMAWHGIESIWFDEYKRSASRETSYFMLNAIAREGLYDEEKFKFWLSDAGYGAYTITTGMLTEYEKTYGLKAPEETQIDFLLRNYRKMSEKAEFSGIQSVAKKAFIRGDISESEFDGYLVKIGKPDEVRGLIIDAAKVEKEEVRRTLSLSIVSKLYRLGNITVEEFRTRLADMGYTEESINDLVELEDLRKQEEPQTLTRSQVEELYEENIIDEAEARARFVNMGYGDSDINLMIALSKRKGAA